jgi:hypothetical protein
MAFITQADFGKKYPHPDDLETGDLLFPRKPNQTIEHFYEKKKNNDEIIDLKIQAIKKEFGHLSAKDFFSRKILASTFNKEKIINQNFFKFQLTEINNNKKETQFDVNDKAAHELIMRIIELQFSDFSKQWVNLSIAELFDHPVYRFILQSLTQSQEIGFSFFIGHVGMVIRLDANGDVARGKNLGEVYVAEINITDPAHYKAGIRLYYDSDSTNLNQKNAWLNGRAADGDYVWLASLKDQQKKTFDWAQKIQQSADKLEGKAFGFFDDTEFGKGDRMYCAEYIWAIYKGATPSIELDDKRTWCWMEEYLTKTEQTYVDNGVRKTLSGLVADARKKFGDTDTNPRKFFLLHTAALWNSDLLKGTNPGLYPKVPYA